MPNETSNWNNIDGHRNIYVNRMPCIVATRSIVQDAFKQHFPGGDPILEIGAGMGVLQSLATTSDEKRIIGSDLNLDPLIHFQNNFPRARLFQADALALPFANNQFRQAVSLAAFDVLHDQNLRRAARELHRIISPSGTFMHILDILPDITILMEPYIRRKKIPFIYYNSENKMRLAFVDQKAFLQKTEEKVALKPIEKILRSTDAAKKFLSLLQRYGRNPVGSILGFNSDISVSAVDIEKGLIGALEVLHIAYEIADSVDVIFGNKLVNELRSAGFKEVTMATQTKKIALPRSEFDQFGIQGTESNFFDNNVGNAISFLIPEIRDKFGRDIIVVQSTVQIIVAKK